jgi:putative Mn2+ efflux pump MntP
MFSLILIALSLSLDAFAVSVCSGIVIKKPLLFYVVRASFFEVRRYTESESTPHPALATSIDALAIGLVCFISHNSNVMCNLGKILYECIKKYT